MRHPRITAALAVTVAAVLAGPVADAAVTPGPGEPGPETSGPWTSGRTLAVQPSKPVIERTRAGSRRPGQARNLGRDGQADPDLRADRLIVPLGVDPACPAKLEVGMRSDAREPLYADMFVEIDQPLVASRPMLSSYLSPGYELVGKLLVGVPPRDPRASTACA